MILSTLRGTLTGVPTVKYVNNEEKFYLVQMRMHKNNSIPVIISEYLLPKEMNARYEIKGHTNSFTEGKFKNKKLFSYFEALNITPIDDSEKDRNNITVSGRLTKDAKYSINYHAVSKLHCAIKYRNSNNKIAISNIILKGSLARQFKDELQENDVISVTGHVDSSAKGFIIIGETVEVLKKGDFNNG